MAEPSGEDRLEIITPLFFAIIPFFNSHTLLLLFLHFSAIIPFFNSHTLLFVLARGSCFKQESNDETSVQ